MLLATVLERVAMECDIQKITIDQYERAVSRYSEFLQRQAESTDLTVDNLNAFIKHLQGLSLSGTTARNYRVSLTRLWNYLTETENFAPYQVRRLRKPKQVAQPVYAWSLDDFSALLTAARTVPGRLKNGVLGSHFLTAWLWTGFDTALRPSDLRLLRWDAIDFSNKTIAISQHKTGNPHNAEIGPETIEALKRISNPQREVVFPLTKGGVRRWELALFREAESLGWSRRSGQGLGTLRKTHATEVYTIDGEAAAAESLGHVGGVRTVRKSYIDHRARRQGRLPRRPDGDRVRTAG